MSGPERARRAVLIVAAAISALAVILFVFVIPLVIYNVRQMRLSEEIR